MSLIIQMNEVGGPEVLRPVETELPPPGPGEVRLIQSAIGLNYIDIYHRNGAFPLPALPAVPGVEAAGIVAAVGTGVTTVAVGDRVAYAGPPAGAYADERNIPADLLLPLPAAIDERIAAGGLLRGLTVGMMLHHLTPLPPDSTILVHAAAGGVGSLLAQWAKLDGLRVIGTVGSAAKVQAARAAGCDEVILYNEVDFAAEIQHLTAGRGVAAVFDGVGGEVLLRSIDCVAPFGALVSYGQASGSLPAIPPALLGPRRSIALWRPGVFAFIADRNRMQETARRYFDLLERGRLSIELAASFPLAEAAAAHAWLESRQASGVGVLVP